MINRYDEIKEILSRKIDVSKINLDSPVSSSGLDSLDLVELMLDIEDEVGVDFTSNEITKLTTFRDVLDLVNSKSK